MVENASRESVALGAEFWNVIPAREQNHLRILLAGQAQEIRYSAIRDWILRGAARAGLLLAGSVRLATEGLLVNDPSADGTSLLRERDFVAACRDSTELRALLTFALSDKYLAARSRALGSGQVQ